LDEKKEKREERKPPEIFDILNLRILGIDFGELIRNWTGVTDIQSLIERPEQLEGVKEKIEEQRAKLREAQEELRKKYGDAIRFDYDIRVGHLMGDREGIRIGGGEFFQRLDELARERAKWRVHRRAAPRREVTIPEKEGVKEPLVEISEREDHLYITAELPGVEEKDIKLNVTDDKVTISANTPKRKYHTEITLPTKVEPYIIEQSYKNGILEVKFKKSV
jgi:HSP20 family molecular chaperone IbpA